MDILELRFILTEGGGVGTEGRGESETDLLDLIAPAEPELSRARVVGAISGSRPAAWLVKLEP
jgi:hypothetical protein